MRLRVPAVPLSALVGAGWILGFFYTVLTPATALANRDIPFFHLPLRLSLRALTQVGPPTWDPWLHGGQPILSNPNYAAFYPPTWLCLVVSPAYSLSLIAMAHMGLAYYGALRLARRLGCGTSTAILAALSFSGGGALLSLLNAFGAFCVLAWLPLILSLALDLAEPPGEDGGAARHWIPRAFYLGLALGLQFLAGEPVFTLITGIALFSILVVAMRRKPRLLGPFLAAGALAALLSSVQLLPTIGRLADSPRGKGVGSAEATAWSMPPSRATEMIFPRLFGDAGRIEEGLFFGWGINDRDYPYVTSLYSGLLLALVGIAALLRGPTARRPAWILMIALSYFLACGRYNPFYGWVREHLPILDLIRYPEKFVVLAVAAIGFAGCVGWQRLLAERDEGRRDRVDFPLVMAGLTFVVALTLALFATLMPALSLWHVRAHGAPGMSAADHAIGVRYLIHESWFAVGATGAVAGLLALVRFGRTPRRRLEALAVVLTALDLWHYGHRMIKSIAIEAYTKPPVLAQLLGPPRDRIYLQEPRRGETDLFRRIPHSETGVTYAYLTRLEPYSGLLWRLPYALHQDYDLMQTDWARRALLTLSQEGKDRELGLRFMGAWNIGTVILRKPNEVWTRELVKNPEALPVGLAKNPYLLERFRFVPIVAFHRTQKEALAVARAQRYALDRREHCVRPGEPPAVVGFPVPPKVKSLDDRVSRVDVSYSAIKGACFVMASTYDPNWRAVVDGAETPIYPTAASQMAMLVPGGDHVLRLEYRDPLVGYGALVSLVTLLGSAAGVFFARRRTAPGALSAPAA